MSIREIKVIGDSVAGYYKAKAKAESNGLSRR
jgi:hypothetical protein